MDKEPNGLRERLRSLAQEIQHVRDLHSSQRIDDKEAIKTALTAANELAKTHNDLIRAQEKKDAQYATKEQLTRVENVQAKMIGGILVVAALVSATGVKVWVS